MDKLTFIYVLVTFSLVQSKTNLKDSTHTSASLAYGHRVGAPISSFSSPLYNAVNQDCTGESLFGMYADFSNGCQSYHVCHGGRKDTFMCPEGTLFSQELMTCDYWYRVSCGVNEQSPQVPSGYYPSWSPQPQPQPQPVPPSYPSQPQPPQYVPPSTDTTGERENPETEDEEPRTVRPTIDNPFAPQPGYQPLPQPGYGAQPDYGNQPGYQPVPQPGYQPVPQPGYQPSPQPGFGAQPGFGPQFGFGPQPGFGMQPQPGFGPQPPQTPPTSGQQPPYFFNDWNLEEPEWTYAWMKKLDSSKSTEPITRQAFDFSLINNKLGSLQHTKETANSPNPWLFPIELYKKAKK